MVSRSASGESTQVSSESELAGLFLENSLRRLRKLTTRLRLLSMYVFVITLLNVAATLAMLAGARFISYQIMSVGELIAALTAVFFLSSLLMIVIYESLRKSGDALFEEVSDELQWNVGYRGKEVNREAAEISPPLDARIILRSFARTTDLPLVPGKYGPAIYAAVNVLSTFFLVFSFIGKS